MSLETNRSGERTPLLANGTANTSLSVSLPSSTVLEPPNVRRSRFISIRIMYFTMFLSAVTFTMTMSTIWPFLKEVDTGATPGYLGWVVASYSMGQLVASPLFGFWSSKRQAREPLVWSLIMQAFANTFYAYIQSVPGNGGGYLVLARVLMGFSSGNAAVVRAYVSGATTIAERTGAMSFVGLFQSVGFILGPVIQTVLVLVGYPGPVEKSWFHFNMYTAPAFLSTLLTIVNFVLLLAFFRLHTVADSASLRVTVHSGEDEDDDDEKDERKHLQDVGGSPDYTAIGIAMFLFFIVFFVFTIFETIFTPLGMDMYGWSKPHASLYVGIMLGVAGFVAIGVFIIIKNLSKRGIDERKLLVSGYAFCFVGFFIFLPWGHDLPAIAEAQLITAPTIPTTTKLMTPSYTYFTSDQPDQNHTTEAALRLQEGSVMWGPGHAESLRNMPQPSPQQQRQQGYHSASQQNEKHPIANFNMKNSSNSLTSINAETASVLKSRTSNNAPDDSVAVTYRKFIPMHSESDKTPKHPINAESKYNTNLHEYMDKTSKNSINAESAKTSENSIKSKNTSITVNRTVESNDENTTEENIIAKNTSFTPTDSSSGTEQNTGITDPTTVTYDSSIDTSIATDVTVNDSTEQVSTQDMETTSMPVDDSTVTEGLTTTMVNSTNTTVTPVDPEGCPWNFGWCGTQPRIQLWQFILGAFFISIGYPICNAMTYSIYSKVLGSTHQGLWMGFITACGSLARTLGPVFVSQIYDASGPRTTFACSCGILVITIIINIISFKRLVPFDESPFRKRSEKDGRGSMDSDDLARSGGVLK